jgi:cytochrome c556
MRASILTCLAAAFALSACSDGPAPEAADPASASDVAAEEPEPDVVHARQALMDEIHAQMLQIDRAAFGEAFDLADARVRAGAVSVILLAYPHLFPEGTTAAETAGNPYPSWATDAVWEQSEAFHEMAEHASEIAFDLMSISDEDAFRAKAAELRPACNSCHAVFSNPPAE